MGHHLVIPLEDLDGVPALLLLRHIVYGGLLDVGDGMFHRAGEGVHGDGLATLGSLNGGLSGLPHTGAFQGGDLHDPAAQLPGQLRHIDPVAVLLHDVHHVDGDDHRNPQLGQLGSQIQVPLQVGAVDDVQNGVGTLTDQVVAGHHFFQRVRGQRVDAGQVHDGHVIVLFQLALLLFHCYTGPVAHELIGSGQGIEQRRLAGVRVAREGNFNLFHIHSFRIAFANRYAKFLFDLNHFGIGLSQGKLISPHCDLHGIPQRRHLADIDLRAAGNPHIHDAALDGTFPVELYHLHGLTDLSLFQCFHISPPCSTIDKTEALQSLPPADAKKNPFCCPFIP